MSAYETEFEAVHESESEAEQEAFFNHLAAAASRSGRPQSLRRVALAAAKEAFRGANRSYPVIEGEGELEQELEGELEQENEFEFEATLNPVAPGAALAMMEHMAHQAANSESESEAAEHFLPLIPLAAKALLPLAAKALPIAAKMGAKFGGKMLGKVAPQLLKRVAPNLTRGVSQLARGLFRNRSTRPLLRAVPSIARRTVGNLAKQIAAGRRITPQGAARVLARQTQRALRSPQQLRRIYRRGRRADAAYHQRARRFVGRPSASSAGSSRGASAGYAGRPAFTAAPSGGGGCQCFRAVPCATCGR
jgi:hypothetical protein